MKKFPYKFTKALKIMMIAMLFVAVGVIIVNVIKFVKVETKQAYDIITFLSTMIIGVGAFIFVLPILFNSQFIIDDKTLTFKWGFLKNKVTIGDIKKIVKNDNNKMAIYFGTENFYMIYIDATIFNDFSKCLVEKNPNIIIEYATAE